MDGNRLQIVALAALTHALEFKMKKAEMALPSVFKSVHVASAAFTKTQKPDSVIFMHSLRPV